MKFREFVLLKEENNRQEIEDIFTQAKSDIESLFKQLYQGTAEMVKSYEKAKLPEELQKQILFDLNNIARKVKGGKSTSNDSLQKSENTEIDIQLKNVFQLIEASTNIVQDIGSHKTSMSGKKVYDFKTVLTNTYRLVLDRMQQLKDSVIKQMKVIDDTHSKVMGIRNTAGNIRNKLSSIGQGLTPVESDKAQDSMDALASVVRRGIKLKLTSADGQTISINPNSTNWKQQVLKLGNKNKIFTLHGPMGEKEEINIGNVEQVYNVIDNMGIEQVSNFIPKSRKNSRAFKMRGTDGKTEKK